MNGKRLLIDSVILIDHFNGIAAATDYLRQKKELVCISAITRAEVLTGFEATGAVAARRFLNAIPLHVIDQEIADLAAGLRRKHRWKLPDALQAATALLHDCLLVTRNTKDFPVDAYDFVVHPYRLKTSHS